jgi:hypothetical protein
MKYSGWFQTIALCLTFPACVSVQVPPTAIPQTTPTAATITPGFDTPTPEANLPTNGQDLPWYAALKVSASRPDTEAGRPSDVLKDNRARSAWKQIVRALGADNGQDKYSFVFLASIAGVELPPLTPIQLTHTKTGGFLGIGGKEEVHIDTDAGVYSPWVPIDRGSKVRIKAQHVGSASPKFTLLEDAVNLSGQIGTVGGWAVAPATQPMLNVAATAVQNAYMSAWTFTNVTGWSIETYPLAGEPGGYSFVMRDVDHNPIAKIKVELVFRRTLRNSPEALDKTTYPSMGGQPIDSPSFLMLDTAGTPKKILDQLAADTILVSALRQPGPGSAGSTAFTNGCNSFLAFLQKAGLNLTDSTFFATRYLTASVNGRPDLATTFWSDCLPQREKIANGIGVGLDIHVALPLSPTNAKAIGNYIVRKGVDKSSSDASEDASVAGMLGPAIMWRGDKDPLTPTTALSKLTGLTATAFHCISRVPIADPSTERYGVTMFLRNGTEPDKVIALYGPSGDEEDAPAALIEYRDPNQAEFKACAAYEKAKNGTPPIAAK